MAKLRFIPTWKIREILNHPFTQGIDGKDYGPVKDELASILWERESKVDHTKQATKYYENIPVREELEDGSPDCYSFAAATDISEEQDIHELNIELTKSHGMEDIAPFRLPTEPPPIPYHIGVPPQLVPPFELGIPSIIYSEITF